MFKALTPDGRFRDSISLPGARRMRICDTGNPGCDEDAHMLSYSCHSMAQMDKA
jgi:hypothetical protein